MGTGKEKGSFLAGYLQQIPPILVLLHLLARFPQLFG